VGREGDPKPKKTKPKPPTLQEWLAYAAEQDPPYDPGDAEQAYYFYDSRGWIVKGSPVKVWRSCLATCYVRWKKESGIGSLKKAEKVNGSAIDGPAGWQKLLPAVAKRQAGEDEALKKRILGYSDTPWYSLPTSLQTSLKQEVARG
jgi:hypothetical protein